MDELISLLDPGDIGKGLFDLLLSSEYPHTGAHGPAEVKLYLNNAYQMTFSTHPTVGKELDDRELVKMVHDVTYALFVINKPETL